MTKSPVILCAALALLPATVIGCRQEPSASVDSDYIAPPAPVDIAGFSDEDRKRIKNFWHIYNQATADNQAGRWARSAELYREALKLDPKHWDSMYYLGNSMVELGRYEEAHLAYRNLSLSDPQAARAFSALGGLYSNPRAITLFNLAKAETMFHRAWRSNGDESGSVLRLGEVCLAAGKLDKAREYLQAAAQTNPKSVNARLLQGYIAWTREDMDRAELLWKQAISLATFRESVPKGLSEGDTRLPGSKPILRTASKGIFDDVAARLSALPPKKASVDVYRELQERIRQLPTSDLAKRAQ